MIRCVLVGDSYDGQIHSQQTAPISVRLPVSPPIAWVDARKFEPPPVRNIVYHRVYLSDEKVPLRTAVYVAEGT